MFKTIGIFVLFLVPSLAMAQNPRSAVGGGGSVWAGGEYSNFNPDYACVASNAPFRCKSDLQGPTALFDVNLRSKWGAEGEARWLHWGGLGNMVEANYLLGGRYRIYRWSRMNIWAKFLLGGGWITTPYYPQAGSLKGSYFAYVPGISADYPISHRISLRADYEYEIWPSFVGPPTGATLHNHGLTPNGVSVGFVYRIFGQ